jgi:hypothetical protein
MVSLKLKADSTNFTIHQSLLFFCSIFCANSAIQHTAMKTWTCIWQWNNYLPWPAGALAALAGHHADPRAVWAGWPQHYGELHECGVGVTGHGKLPLAYTLHVWLIPISMYIRSTCPSPANLTIPRHIFAVESHCFLNKMIHNRWNKHIMHIRSTHLSFEKFWDLCISIYSTVKGGSRCWEKNVLPTWVTQQTVSHLLIYRYRWSSLASQNKRKNDSPPLLGLDPVTSARQGYAPTTWPSPTPNP